MSIFSRTLRAFSFLALALALALPAHAVTLKLATVSPEGSGWMKVLRKAGKEIAERTDSRVKLKFYPGGVMGDDKAVMRKIRIGQLHGAVLTTGPLISHYKDIQIFNLTMAFRSLEEIDYVRERLDAKVLAGLEDNGFTAFGFAEVGFAYAFGANPGTSVDFARQQKVWIPEGDAAAAQAISAFGITPVPLSITDVLAGLQTGLINGVASPPIATLALQWHTQLKHAIDLPLLYVYGMLALNNKSFNKLSAEDQAVLRDVLGKAVDEVNATSRSDHEQALAVMKKQGIQFATPSATEVEVWRAAGEEANQGMVDEGLLSPEMYAEVMKLLAEYRATSG
ncbi:MAG: TRAP transporter substrate-binding protein DctP [Pseudomonadota bacterium]